MGAGEWDRFADLQKQGFMKSKRARKPKVEKPIVACDDCLNWHREGQHTADRATRKANREARKASARDPKMSKSTQEEAKARAFIARGKAAENSGSKSSAAVWYRKASAAYKKAGVDHRARYWGNLAKELKSESSLRRDRPKRKAPRRKRKGLLSRIFG